MKKWYGNFIPGYGIIITERSVRALRYSIHSSDRHFPLGIISIGCSSSPRVTRYGPTRRDQYIIHYVIGGRGFFNGHPIDEGEGFLIYPGMPEEYHPDDENPWEFLWIIAEGEGMRALMAVCGADEQTKIFRYSFIPAVRELCDYLKKHNDTVASPLACMEIVTGLMKHHEARSLSCPGSYTAYDYALIAKNWLHENYGTRATISELTSRLGVSQSYLFRIFREVHGCSPKKYLTNLRIRQAKFLLTSTDMSVTEVGAAVGFEDVLLFSKFFSRGTGLSPTRYRSGTENL